MVLSNRKLKQKLRSLAAESLANAESLASGKSKKKHRDGTLISEVDRGLQSIKELLSSKKSKRKKKVPLSSEESSKPAGRGEEDAQKENGLVGSDEKERSGKRKREGGGVDASGEKEGKKRSKKVKKWWKEKRAKKGEDTNGNAEEEKLAEAVVTEESEPNTKKIYVGGIPYYSTEDDIRSFFESCGTITEVDCMMFPETGKFRGIAMLTFKTEAAAKRALALDGADMGGFYLKIQPYKVNRAHKSDFAPEIVDGYNRVYVGNLSWDITEEDLRKFFSDCSISSIRFGMDKETGEFKGYAHVDFADSASLAVALKLDQQVVCGRPARITCAVPKKLKEPSQSLKSDVKKEEEKKIAGDSRKMKRRTCYECGIPGHISSSCPRKRVTEENGSSVTS